MTRSNLFAHIELTKFADGLCVDIENCRSSLISQHAYFTLIPAKMLSQELALEWEDICKKASKAGPERDEDGRIIANSVRNTLVQLPKEDCLEIAERVMRLQQKVAAEF